MLKSELAAKVQEKAHLKTKGQAEEAVNAVIAALKDALEQGETISFMGLELSRSLTAPSARPVTRARARK